VTSSDEAVGDATPVSDHELTARVHRALTAASAGQPGLAVRSVHVSRGWGEILFVRIHARMRGSGHQTAEDTLRGAVQEALEGERSSVSVSWSF